MSGVTYLDSDESADSSDVDTRSVLRHGVRRSRDSRRGRVGAEEPQYEGDRSNSHRNLTVVVPIMVNQYHSGAGACTSVLPPVRASGSTTERNSKSRPASRARETSQESLR